MPGRSVVVVGVLACACASIGASEDEVDASSSCAGKCDGAGGTEELVFRVCEREPAPPLEAQGSFEHTASAFVALGAPWHSAQDVLATTGAFVTLEAKFAYGTIGKDLEHELVEFWIDDCDGLRFLGLAETNGDGRARLETSELPTMGRYRVHARVVGDGSGTSATLAIVPPDTRVAVFDIDGTLTTTDWELVEDIVDDLFEPILHGDAPDARSGAAEITRARDAQGYLVVYLTGRPYWLTQRSRDWLDARGMAPGILHTTQRSRDMLPTVDGVGTYKADFLAELELAGLDIDVAYGNATTDIFAYDEAGIARDATFVLGRHGGEDGTVDLGDAYDDHLAKVDLTPIEQPFVRAE